MPLEEVLNLHRIFVEFLKLCVKIGLVWIWVTSVDNITTLIVLLVLLLLQFHATTKVHMNSSADFFACELLIFFCLFINFGTFAMGRLHHWLLDLLIVVDEGPICELIP